MKKQKIGNLVSMAMKGRNPQMSGERMLEAYDIVQMKDELIKLAQKNIRILKENEELKQKNEELEHSLKQTNRMKEKDLQLRFNYLKMQFDQVQEAVKKAFGKPGLEKFKYHLDRI
jgi:seryl-tRNA synthetase